MPEPHCPNGHHLDLKPLWGEWGCVGYLFVCDCTKGRRGRPHRTAP